MKVRLSKYDKIWSKLVRERDGRCLNCGKTDSLNAHHVIMRGKKSTRLLLENGISLCAGCHVFSPNSVHRSPDGSKAFCIRLIGSEEYARLERLSVKPMKEAEAVRIFLQTYPQD